MKAFIAILLSLSSLGLLAQGWVKEMPAIPKQFPSVNGASISGTGGNSDTIINVTSIDYGAANFKEMYVISHNKDGLLLDYFQLPTIETKKPRSSSEFFFLDRKDC